MPIKQRKDKVDVVYIHNDLFSSPKEQMPFVGKWMKLEIFILTEVRPKRQRPYAALHRQNLACKRKYK